MAKTANGVVTTFVHDGAQVVAEYEAPVYQSQDIGSPTLAGSWSDSGTGTVTVSASGADIFGTTDQFRYAYLTLTGDGSITAKVATQTNTNAAAKAGVMLRDSFAANAKHAMVSVTPSSGVVFQRRTATGSSTNSIAAGIGVITAPYWVRLTRVGTTIAGYMSSDGVSWTLLGTDTISFTQATIYAGLAVTSHTNATISTATFTNVVTTGNAITTTSPAFARGYVYGSYVDEPLALITPTQKYYYHANHLYSVAALTNQAGAVVERYRYVPIVRPLGLGTLNQLPVGEAMLITKEQYADFQQGVVQQVAQRLGLSDPQIYPVDELLGRIEKRDLNAFHAVMQFKNTYREWYERSDDLEKAVQSGRAEDATKIRDLIRELRLRRDHQRKLLVGYLDANYSLHAS